MDAQYRDICFSKLNLDENTTREGWEILKKIRALQQKPEDNTSPLVWVACALFLASFNQSTATTGDSEGSAQEIYGNGLKLTQLLHVAHLTMVQFFEHLSLVVDKLSLEQSIRDTIATMNESFISSNLLFKKYSDLWAKRYAFCLKVKDLPTDPAASDLLFQFGWMIFVTSSNMSEDIRDLGHNFPLLAASLLLVLSNAPVNSRATEFDVATALTAMGSPQKVSEAQKRQQNSLLEAICSATHLSATDVEGAVTRLLGHIDGLTESGILRTSASEASQTSSSEDKDPLASPKIRSLLASPQITTNVNALLMHYEASSLFHISRIDERFFLNPVLARNIGTPSKLSSSARPLPPAPSNAGRKLFQEDEATSPPRRNYPEHQWNWQGKVPPRSPAPPRSPMKPMGTPQRLGLTRSPMQMQTPVTAAMEMNRWVKEVIETCSNAPSKELKLFFAACSPSNPQEAIAQRVNYLSLKISPTNSSHSWRRREAVMGVDATSRRSLISQMSGNSSAAGQPASEVAGGITKTKALATSLYYKVLEEMLISERERLKTNDFGSLLSNDKFNRALFACSMEAALKANSLVTLCFPRILDLFDISAFDLSKVIESFVRHVPNLPSILKRRMNEIEEIILESEAWTSSSPLWGLLKDQGTTNSTTTTTSAANGKLDGSKAVAVASKENSDKQGTAALNDKKGEAGQTTGGSAAPKRPKSSALDIFFRKVLSLAASRIYELCKGIDMKRHYFDQVWTAVKWILSDRLILLRDRHLDQVILCSIYGVSKVNKIKPEITFKRIIEVYKQMPHHSPRLSVIRDIALSTDAQGARGDVIKFYNKVFIPEVKTFLLQFQHQNLQQVAADAVAKDGPQKRLGLAQTAVQTMQAAIHSISSSSTASTHSGHPSAAPGGAFGAGAVLRGLLPNSPSIHELPLPIHVKSPQRVLASNVYLSPRRPTPEGIAGMTPRTRGLYAFGESPSRDLALINWAVNGQKRPPPTLSFEEEEEVPHAKRKLLPKNQAIKAGKSG